MLVVHFLTLHIVLYVTVTLRLPADNLQIKDITYMETAALVAPVTALEFLQDAFLLTGRQLEQMHRYSFNSAVGRADIRFFSYYYKVCHVLLFTILFLAGEGPLLKAYSLQPRRKACTSLSVLQHFRIHGIRPRNQEAVAAWSSAAGARGKNELGS